MKFNFLHEYSRFFHEGLAITEGASRTIRHLFKKPPNWKKKRCLHHEILKSLKKVNVGDDIFLYIVIEMETLISEERYDDDPFEKSKRFFPHEIEKFEEALKI